MYYDTYHEFDQFRAEYQAKFLKPPYVGPYMRFRWQDCFFSHFAAATLTPHILGDMERGSAMLSENKALLSSVSFETGLRNMYSIPDLACFRLLSWSCRLGRVHQNTATSLMSKY